MLFLSDAGPVLGTITLIKDLVRELKVTPCLCLVPSQTDLKGIVLFIFNNTWPRLGNIEVNYHVLDHRGNWEQLPTNSEASASGLFASANDLFVAVLFLFFFDWLVGLFVFELRD